jgi:GntR family transcriptional regulator
MMFRMKLDSASHVPLYAQVELALAASIADGSLKPGTQLPSEEALIERFAVSRTTIRLTIQNLARRGLVEIQRGKGTFVTEPKLTQELTELSGFVEDMQALGRHATARVLDQQVVAASFASSGCAWPTACRSRSTRPGCRESWANR